MDTPEFIAFWTHWPKRVNKQAARDAFAWAMKRHNGDGQLLQKMIDAIAWQVEFYGAARFLKDPDKWLLGMRWEDERPLTQDEQASLVSFRAWQAANAHDPETRTVSFDMFRRYQQAQRRAG